MTKFYFAVSVELSAHELKWSSEVCVEADNLEEAKKKVREMYDEPVRIGHLVEID